MSIMHHSQCGSCRKSLSGLDPETLISTDAFFGSFLPQNVIPHSVLCEGCQHNFWNILGLPSVSLRKWAVASFAQDGDRNVPIEQKLLEWRSTILREVGGDPKHPEYGPARVVAWVPLGWYIHTAPFSRNPILKYHAFDQERRLRFSQYIVQESGIARLKLIIR